MFRTRLFRLFLTPLAALVALTGATGASASQPSPVSGTFTTTSSTFNSVREAGGNVIIDLTATLEYTGSLEGTSTLHGTLIFHADGSANFHDFEVFTGTVNGVPGTLTFNLSGGSNPEGEYHGNAVFISGTGALSGMRGRLNQTGMVTGPPGPYGTYGGQVHFAP